MADVLWNPVFRTLRPVASCAVPHSGNKNRTRGAPWRSQDSGGTETGASLGRHIAIGARCRVGFLYFKLRANLACVSFVSDFNQIRGLHVER
jgi:hypothetical protein